MNNTDTFVIYKSSLHNEIYKWNKCSNNSECINTIGSFNCTCLPGYDGDGFDCIDINECKLNEINQNNNNYCFYLNNIIVKVYFYYFFN